MAEKRYKMYDVGSPYLTHCGVKSDDDYFDNMTECCEEMNRLADENVQLKQQMNRLYNYFEDWYSDMTSANDFSEIWDNVKEDERWRDNE